MNSTSVVSPERRIELNSFDVDAWNLLLRENHSRPIDQARPFYEKLVAQFPNSGRYWKAYIEHELRSKNFENVENLFGQCLITVLNIDLWKCYVFYVRETKGHLPSFREKMAKAYDFALDKVGLDINAHSLYADYISFLKSVPAVGQYAENQRITVVRKVYQRAIATPMQGVEKLWDEYQAYEKGVNATLAEKLINERNKEFQLSRRIARTLEQMTRGINRQAASVPPRGTATEMKQVELWKKYIEWEKSNPLDTEEYGSYAKRVMYAYEQALLCLGYYPEIWYEAALFMQKAANELELKGDVKQAGNMRDEAIQLFDRAIAEKGLMRESQLLYFAYADFQEERKQFEKVKEIYEKLFAMEHVDPSLGYIQLMRFIRRTEGVKAARVVFKRAKGDARATFHVYVAHALQEYYCSKDRDVAMRVFDLGLKKYGDEPEYCLAYVDFLTHLNEDNNTRVVFERILTSGALAKERSGMKWLSDIWDKYLEFESLVGDLASTLKVDERRRASVCVSAEIASSTLMLIDRYRFMNLAPCSTEQLRLMGYHKPSRSGGSSNGTPSSLSAAGPSGLPLRVGITVPAGPSSVMGGGSTVEITGYPRPDTSQMLPFKPKRNAVPGAHAVPGGIFPPPPEAAHLISMLPPPWCFDGPFVVVEALMDQLAKFTVTEPAAYDTSKPVENGTLFGTHRVEDIKKEMYQLLATTTDPRVAMSTGGELKRKRGGDSDEEDDKNEATARDVYKRRMNSKQ